MSWLRMASVALVGAAAGIAAAVVAGKNELPSAPEPVADVARAPASEPDRGRRPRTDEAMTSARLARLEEELAELRGQEAPQPQDSSTDQAVDDEAESARVQERFATALQDFERAQVDPTWAPQASKSLRTDLGALSERLGFDLEDVECKDRRCVAQLRWATHQKAAQQFAAVAHSKYSVNCAIDIVLKRPDGEAANVANPVIFSNCQ